MKFILQKLLIILLIVLNSSYVCSQVTQEEISVPNHAPLAPEVAALTKYKEVPVNMYTGVPNISIPIYTIKTGNIEVPIALSYYAGGHKVEEIATWVGLGWSLNAGGTIYRQTRQLPDDSPPGYIHTARTVAEWENTSTYSGRRVLEQNAKRGFHDYEPDNFQFNFLDYKGGFYFNQNRSAQHPYGELIQFPVSDIKIEYTLKPNGMFDYWKITTPDGTKYFFDSQWGDFLSSHYSYYGDTSGSLPIPTVGHLDNSIPHNTSWKLSKIETSSGELIEFEYEPYSYSNNCIPSGESTSISNNSVSGTNSFTTHLSSGTNFRLKKISFKNGYVEFITQGERLDLSYDKALEEIFVYSKLQSSTTSTLLQRTKLIYDYFESATTEVTSICLGNYNPDEINKRLCLKEIEFYGNQLFSSDNIKYTFEYNTDVLLPHRFSKSQDYWGYYNGKSNTTLIPTTFSSVFSGNLTKSIVNKGNREIDVNYTQACILKRINYPEGGFTEFTYENNERNPINVGFGIDMIYEPSVQKTAIVNSNHTMITNPQTGRRYFRTNFDVSEEISYDNYFTFTTSSTICDNSQTDPVEPNINLPILGCDIVLHIKNRVLGQPNLTHPNGLPIGYNGKLFIQPGQYTLEIEIKSNSLNINNAFIEVIAQWKENKYPGKKIIGGLRVKEIKDFKSGYILNQTDPNVPIYELDETTTITRKYIYKNNDNSPSGWVVGVPVFRSFSKSEGSIENPPQLSEIINSSSTNNSISSDANNLGYFCVREIRVTEDKEIIKEESFTGDTATSSYPGSPLYHSWTSGRSTRQRLFRKKTSGGITDLTLDGTFDILNSTQTYYYSVATLPSNYPLSTRGLNIHQTYFSESQADLNEKTIYNVISGTNLGAKEQIETDYFYENGVVSSIENKTKTLYHNLSENGTPLGIPHHFLPVKKINILDNGSQTVETNYYYIYDLIGNNLFNQTVISQLNANHQINTPLLRETFQNGNKTSTLVTHYKDWGNNSLGKKVLMPEIVQSAKGSTNPLPLENRLRYVNIDPLGAKPREMQQENGTSVVYIWGYDKSLPVAKIENIAYSSIPTNLITAIQTATTEAGLISALNALRSSNALVSAQVFTFTHIPLVGVKTMTDPKGYTTTYHYDSFNRLEKVTDMQSNILSENKYHYRTQN